MSYQISGAPVDEVEPTYPMVSLHTLPRPKFAFHLMAPMITLYVGRECIEYHAHEDTLCKLPFFKAALQGNFKEASEKTINMPEDSPGLIAALIEYLYTGDFAYQCDDEDEEIQWPVEIEMPSEKFEEAYFHWELSVTARKYLCEELATKEAQRMTVAYRKLKDIEKLRFWKAVYVSGSSSSFEVEKPDKLRKWINCTRKEHPEEFEEALLGCPKLTHDLLCAVSKTS